MSILELAGNPIVSGLTGGLFATVNAVVGFFQKREDNKQQLALKDKERELLALTTNLEQAKLAGALAIAREQGAGAAFTASIENEGRLRGEHRAITSLRASVRPVLVYTYQLVFFVLIAAAILAWFKQWAAEAELVPLIQYMVVATINTANMTVAWYFGQRQMDKAAITWGNKYAGATVAPGKGGQP